MIKSFDEIFTRIQNSDLKKMAVVAAADEHTIEAVIKAHDEKIASAILIGDSEKIQELLEQKNAKGFEIIDAKDDREAAKIAVELANKGEADFIMKGGTDTKVVLKAVLNDNPISGNTTMSHIGALLLPTYHKLLFITDGGMIPYPDFDDKRAILENVLELLRSIGYERPKIACLAAVEKMNPKLKETVDGAKLKEMAEEGKFGECVVEGPISFDLIYNKEASELKGYESEVAGDADVILAPDMVCGNTLAKALNLAGKGVFCGIIYGALYPIVLTSRSMSAEEKFNSIAMAALVGRKQI